MLNDRLPHALEAGLPLADARSVVLYGPGAEVAFAGDLPALDPDRVTVVQSFAPAAQAWEARGYAVQPSLEGGPFDCVIVCLPRSRDWAEAMLANACAAAPGGLVIVDGAKTDGIEPILKALKAGVALSSPVAKAHGKIAWFRADAALADWTRPAMQRNAEGDWVAPGLFSTDAADPGSRALAEALPETLSGAVADLGAGWGWLSRAILARDGVTALHLVEAEARALDCALRNVTDPRAQFHWADATDWSPPGALDAVVMNPPFHMGRKADPALGRAFIAAAARMLAPQGDLWLVANRHLPYETALDAHFTTVKTAAQTNGFKVLHATRPRKPGARPKPAMRQRGRP